MIRIPLGFALMMYSLWRFIKTVFASENPGQTITAADLPHATVVAGDGHWHVPPSAAGWLILLAIGALMFLIPTAKERKLGK